VKAYISVDLEGMPYIVSSEQLGVKGALYGEARKIATTITVHVAETLHQLGFEEVLIADSHGPMVNVLVEELPEYVEIIRGFPRPLAMIVDVEDCDAVLFLGYHAKARTIRATFDHTYSGIVNYIKVNGVEVSECLLNAYVAGHYNVPVILVAGDKQLLDNDVNKYIPWAERVTLKSSYGRYSSRSPSLAKLKRELKEATSRAVEKLEKGEVKPLKTSYPVNVELSFISSAYADVAELSTDVERINATTIKYTVKDIVEAYKLAELMILAAVAIRRL